MSVFSNLTNPSDLKSEPKVFTLFELLQNGSNLGKMANKIKPTLGVTDFGVYTDEDEEVHLIYDEFYLETKDYSDDIWDSHQQKFVPTKERKEHLKNISKFIKKEIKKENGDLSSTLESNSTVYIKVGGKGLKKYYSEKKTKNKTNFMTRIINLFK